MGAERTRMLTMPEVVALYEVDVLPGDVPILRCIRCGEWVTYLTMHARVRHGDDVEVAPPLEGRTLSAMVW